MGRFRAFFDSDRGLGPSLLAMVLLLAIGAVAPKGRFVRAMHNPDPNRADLEAGAGGYYVGLIDGHYGPQAPIDNDILGKPTRWVSFLDSGVARPLEDEFIQFELIPNLSVSFHDESFSTNSYGFRDREYPLEKPKGTVRIALLGSSMDMGWGVPDGHTYENRLEEWLNIKARERKDPRRFEILNFAVAAYGPPQRLDAFLTRARGFEPDVVLYSATMLDPRLSELHIRGVLHHQVDPKYPYLKSIVESTGLAEAKNLSKDTLKSHLRGHEWGMVEGAYSELARVCREANLPLVMMIIPRVGAADAPSIRGEAVERYKSLAGREGTPVLDLTDTFDGQKREALEIAPWDDHPNSRGHQLLFYALAKRWLEDPAAGPLLFSPSP